MVELKELSSEDLARLRRYAGDACFIRLSQIARAADPSDQALQDLLMKMASEAPSRAKTSPLDTDRRLPASGRLLSFNQIREAVLLALPSLSKSFGEGTLHRDIALFYAESLEEEASRFYRMLAGAARESRDRSVFFDLSERERGRLRFLREVVLQS